MINFITHPAISNMLEQSRVKMKYASSLAGIVIVSDFLPGHKNNIHPGLLEAVKYRLVHPTHYIILLSFHSKEQLFQYDTFGILSMRGTEFIQLPFEPERLYSSIDKFIDNELSLPNVEWVPFATHACSRLIKEKICLIMHGNELDFVNEISGPLRAAAVSLTSFPELLLVVKRQLQSVKYYIAKEEMAELFLLASVGESLPDSFLQTVLQFAQGLRKLDMYSTLEEIDTKQLITEIDMLNEAAIKIQIQ